MHFFLIVAKQEARHTLFPESEKDIANNKFQKTTRLLSAFPTKKLPL